MCYNHCQLAKESANSKKLMKKKEENKKKLFRGPGSKERAHQSLVIRERAANDPDFDIMSWESDDGWLI